MQTPPSITSTLALILWPFVVFFLFRRFARPKAALYSFIIGLLFLPEHAVFKFPAMPVLDKHVITNLVLLLMLWIHGGRARTESWLRWLWLLLIAGPFATWATNLEPLLYATEYLAPITFKDTMFVIITDSIGGVLAIYLGMRFFRSDTDLVLWVRTLAVAGLGYSVFLLLELRLSPQLHNWLYGYHPHPDFLQSMRWGGYRPVAFMSHGLATSLFMLGTLIACIAVVRRGGGRIWKLGAGKAAWLLSIVTVLCKSTAVWAYMMFAIPLARFAKPKAMVRMALVLAAVTCSYPALRVSGLFPTQTIMDYASSANADRAASMLFRFTNEELLIEHTREKVWFGWSWNHGRNQVYSAWGQQMTVTDGGWIIAFSGGGVLGLVVYLGLVIACIVVVAGRIRKIRDEKQQVTLACLLLYLAICWVDILPNGTFNMTAHFLAGALCSISRNLLAQSRDKRRDEKARKLDERRRKSTALRPVAVVPPAG